jgi:hypothetical protein
MMTGVVVRRKIERYKNRASHIEGQLEMAGIQKTGRDWTAFWSKREREKVMKASLSCKETQTGIVVL